MTLLRILPATALAAALLAILPATCADGAEAPPPPPPPGAQQPPAPGADQPPDAPPPPPHALKAPARPAAPPAGADLYRLPDDLRGPGGALNQAAILAQQKARAAVINERLGLRLKLQETTHYLLLSDAGGPLTDQFARWAEALYASLCRQFDLSARERVWDGKCVLLLFARRTSFEAYARTFDGHDAREAGAYFAVETHADADPRLIHMAIPLDQRDPRRLQELFAHEGTHALFELYRTPGRLPLWLHEGLAEYMTTVNDPALVPAKWAGSVRIAGRPGPVRALLAAQPGEALSLDQYSAAYTLVDALLESGRPKFRRLIHALKDGRTVDEALRDAYDLDTDGLLAAWRTHVRAKGM